MKRNIWALSLAAGMLLILCSCGNSEQVGELETKVAALEEAVTELQTKNDELMSWYEEIQTAEAEMEAARPDFVKLYEAAPDDGSATLASDGLSLTIDTNPFNIENYMSSDSLTYIQNVNTILGLPDSLYEKMLATRALDGRQSSDYDNVSVSWAYHPDTGLEVIYEAK